MPIDKQGMNVTVGTVASISINLVVKQAIFDGLSPFTNCTINVEIFVVTIFRGLNFRGNKFSWMRVSHRNGQLARRGLSNTIFLISLHINFGALLEHFCGV